MAYPIKFRQCKGSSHHWEDYEPMPGEFRKPEFGHRWVQYCANCEGYRHRLVNRITGAVLDSGWQYRMPEDFKPSKAMTKQDYRRLYFRTQGRDEAKQLRTTVRRHLRSVKSA